MVQRFSITALVALAIGLSYGTHAWASIFIPFGPQNDVQLTTVTGAWEWTLVYRGSYAENSVDLGPILSSLGTHVMLGAIRNDLSTIDVLAATTVADFTTHTNFNATTTSNGAQWYYNGGSLGFAGLGDSIAQNQADVAGLGERDRLSWHTNGPGGFIGEYNASPTDIRFGWRSGNNTGLNGATNWDKLIFTGTLVDPGVVPEPFSLAVWTGLGLAATVVAIRARRVA
jgi:hypothetical protein